jgi:hypothetical protein
MSTKKQFINSGKGGTMALIRTIEPEKAEGKIKEIYGIIQEKAGVIPAPMQLASASPWMFDMF